jgi:hypothetical protein
MAKWASWIHKWLALLMAIQILFWFVSGLFFAIAPIETVRSEHRIASQEIEPLVIDEISAQFAALDLPEDYQPSTLEVRRILDRPVVVLTSVDDSRSLYDLLNGQRLSPITSEIAQTIAESHLTSSNRRTEQSMWQPTQVRLRHGDQRSGAHSTSYGLFISWTSKITKILTRRS